MGLYEENCFIVNVLGGGEAVIDREELFRLFNENIATYYGMGSGEILAMREGYLRAGGPAVSDPDEILKFFKELSKNAKSYQRFVEGVHKQMEAKRKWDREHAVDFDADQ